MSRRSPQSGEVGPPSFEPPQLRPGRLEASLRSERAGLCLSFCFSEIGLKAQDLRACSSNLQIQEDSRAARRGAVFWSMHGAEKRLVYIIRSDSDPSRDHVVTNNVPDRLECTTAVHPGTPCRTGHGLLWSRWSFQQNVRFERYLKSGSVRAFTKRHFTLIAAERQEV